MKCSLGISNFLKEISSLSHSIIFLYFFALITEEGFLISPCILWNSAFKWVYLSISPLPFTSLLLTAILKPPQTINLPFCISFSWGWSWSQPPVQCHKESHDPDNHDGMITLLEPNILEWEVEWALGDITMNKASGGDGIPAELFQTQNMMLWNCCTQYVTKFGKLSRGHRTGKSQASVQSQRKAMPKNAQTITQLQSSHKLERNA